MAIQGVLIPITCFISFSSQVLQEGSAPPHPHISTPLSSSPSSSFLQGHLLQVAYPNHSFYKRIPFTKTYLISQLHFFLLNIYRLLHYCKINFEKFGCFSPPEYEVHERSFVCLQKYPTDVAGI